MQEAWNLPEVYTVAELNCDSDCLPALLENEGCDIVCNTSACAYDNGHCLQCSDFCVADQVGDGVCHPYCNNEQCFYDNGDCDNSSNTLYQAISIAGFCLIAIVFVW